MINKPPQRIESFELLLTESYRHRLSRGTTLFTAALRGLCCFVWTSSGCMDGLPRLRRHSGNPLLREGFSEHVCRYRNRTLTQNLWGLPFENLVVLSRRIRLRRPARWPHLLARTRLEYRRHNFERTLRKQSPTSVGPAHKLINSKSLLVTMRISEHRKPAQFLYR